MKNYESLYRFSMYCTIQDALCDGHPLHTDGRTKYLIYVPGTMT